MIFRDRRAVVGHPLDEPRGERFVRRRVDHLILDGTRPTIENQSQTDVVDCSRGGLPESRQLLRLDRRDGDSIDDVLHERAAAEVVHGLA